MPYQIAQVYALRNEAALMLTWTDRDPGVGYLLMDQFILRFRDDPRFAAFCKKVGLPTTTSAKAVPPAH